MLKELEQKILYILDEDSSQSLTEIGEKVGITPQLAKYHLKKMEESGIILAYWPMVDFRKLGYSNTSFFLKLKNLTDSREKEILRFLKKNSQFNIVMLGDGYWDMHFTISAKSVFEAIKLFNIFFDKYSNFILSYDVAISAGFYQFRRDYLAGKRIVRRPTKKFMAYTGGEVKVESLSLRDLRIIELYNKNCRVSYAKLARLAELSRDQVIYALRKLRQKNILQSNAILFDHEKAGFPRYRILLQMNDLTSEKFKSFYDYCAAQPNIVHLLRLFGNWQALIDVEIGSRAELRKILREINKKFSDLVIRIENTQVYSIEKFRDIPSKIV